MLFRSLTAAEHDVLYLFAYVNRNPDRIAADMEMSPSEVRGILHRCCNLEVPRALRILLEHTPEPEPTVGQTDMIGIGLTYRQLDYWTVRGYLQVLGHPSPGTGRYRRWPVAELGIASLILRLIKSGLELAMAARVARDGRHELAPGIRLSIDEDGT